MLALKQALSLVSTKPISSTWTPTDESTLQAWYQNKVGIILNGSDVNRWNDSSTNGRDMVQNTLSEQPAYDPTIGALTFDGATKTNLETSSTMSGGSDFTLGIRIKPTSNNGTFLASNIVANELFKISSSSTMTIKIDGNSGVLALDSGTWGDGYIVISRISNTFSLSYNGVKQNFTTSISGIIDIDAIGVRKTDANGFDGDIKEIQIYSSASSTLTNRINARLSTL